MSVLKVTEVEPEEVAKEDVVEAGQVRKDEEGNVVLVVDGLSHDGLRIQSELPANKFLTVFLSSPGDSFIPFEVDENYGLATAQYIEKCYPTLLEAEMTYKEAK